MFDLILAQRLDFAVFSFAIFLFKSLCCGFEYNYLLSFAVKKLIAPKSDSNFELQYLKRDSNIFVLFTFIFIFWGLLFLFYFLR